MTQPAITRFEGKHAFLSNFYHCPFTTESGELVPTVEHAYQAAKTTNRLLAAAIRNAPTAGQAKRAGNAVRLRSDWEAVRVPLMKSLRRAQFRSSAEMRQMLLATGDAVLVEGNDHHDNFWGVCSCPTCGAKASLNTLGELLMELRKEISCST